MRSRVRPEIMERRESNIDFVERGKNGNDT
jgi:hypothetical protein